MSHDSCKIIQLAKLVRTGVNKIAVSNILPRKDKLDSMAHKNVIVGHLNVNSLRNKFESQTGVCYRR